MDAITNNSSPDFKQTWRIIITEDNEGINRLIYKNLTRLGYLCIQTYNGQQTVDVVKKSEKQILILDYKLPDKNGEEVIKALQEKNGSAPPFIVLTGFGDENLAVKMMKLGATDYITKVNDFIDVLGEKLKRICEEQEKSEENERYEKLLNETERLAGVGGWLWYVKQDKWVMSDNWLAIHGCSEKILTSDLLMKKAHPDDIERVKAAFNKTVNKGESYEIEHRIIRQDNNEVRYIKAFGKPELDADGKVHLVAGSAMDITKQKENELLLATSREMLLEAGRIAKVGGWELDVEKKRLTWTGITRKIHEVPEDFIPNLESAIQFYQKEYRKKLKSLIQRAIEKGESYQIEVPLKTAKGNHIWTHSIGNPVVENGKCIKVRGIIQDITERKKADMQLRDSEERLKVLFESSPDAVYLHDLKGKFIDGNKAAEKMLGYSREELIGKNFTKLNLLPAQYLKKAARSLLENAQGKAAGPDEFELIHRNGHKVPVEIRSFPVNILGKKLIMGIVHDITNRKKAEKKIRESEEKFRSIFDNAAMGIFRSTPKGRYQEVNEAFARILGFESPQKLITEVTDISKLYKHPEDREKIKEEFAEKGYVENYEVIANHPRTETVWISINAKQQKYPDGHIYYEGTIQDITQKKIAEEKLSETEQRLHILADNIPDEIFIKDDQHRFVYVNPQKASLEGVSPEEMIGKTDFDFFSDPIAQKSYQDDEQVLKSGKPIINKEERLIGNDGDSRWVLVTKLPRTDPFGNIVGTMGISRDITKRKIAEKELITAKEKAEENEKKLIEAQEISHVGSWEYIIETDSVTWSKELYNIFELSYDLPAPKYAEQKPFYTEESYSKMNKALQDCIRDEIPYEVELDIITSGGAVKQIISKGNAKRDANNKIIGSYGTAQDITVQKKLESELIAAKEKAEESDKLKSAFLANMSHEIRTPMNGILGFTNLLQEPSLTGEQQKEFIDIIQKSGDRMLNTVNDLIDISRIETGQVKVTKEQIDICHEIKSLYTFFQPEAEQKGLQFTFENNLRDVDSRIITDKTKFVSITTNLIKNALKYTKEGSVKIGCEIKDGNFIFHVNDTGIGIPKNRQQAIFNRFEQADIGDTRVFEGSGLGLAITKAYVEMLNGNIWLESEEGVGSMFGFSLPWTGPENPVTETPEIVKSRLQSGVNPKILIAEDDEVSFFYLSIVFEKHAREIIHALNGRQAVELCKQHPDTDVVLMDIKMPVMDGIEATQKIREFNKDVVIIAQTAYALAGDDKKTIEAGCNDYIAKPADADELLKKIEKYSLKNQKS